MPVDASIILALTKPAVRRWRPRFFLLTLLLFVLTIGSSATLWWNRGSWQLAYVIDDKAPIRDAGITPEGKYVFTLADKAPVKAGENPPQDSDMAPWLLGSSDVTLRDTASGAVRFTFHSKEPGQRVLCSPTGAWVVLYHWSGLSCADYALKVWSARDGREAAQPKDFPRGFIVFSPRDDFAASFQTLQPHESMVVSLPDWKEVRKDDDFRGFAHGKTAFLCSVTDRENANFPKATVNLIALPSGETLQHWDVDGFAQHAALSPDDSKVAVSIQQPSGTYRVAVFDAATRREVATTSGYLLSSVLDETFSSDGTKLPVNNSYASSVGVDWGQWEFATGCFTPFRVRDEHSVEFQKIVSPRDGAPLIDLSDLRWRARVNFPIRAVQFNADETCCVCYAAPDWYNKLPLDAHAAVFRKVRPDGSGGLLRMPELWMTIVLAGGFLWSAIRKR